MANLPILLDHMYNIEVFAAHNLRFFAEFGYFIKYVKQITFTSRKLKREWGDLTASQWDFKGRDPLLMIFMYYC